IVEINICVFKKCGQTIHHFCRNIDSQLFRHILVHYSPPHSFLNLNNIVILPALYISPPYQENRSHLRFSSLGSGSTWPAYHWLGIRLERCEAPHTRQANPHSYTRPSSP